MRRWQYRVVNLGTVNTGPRLEQVLGRLGSEGWELVTVMDKASNWIAWEKGFALFKRPIDPGDPEPTQWAFLESANGQASADFTKTDASGWM